MEAELKAIVAEAETAAQEVRDRPGLEALKARFLGGRGSLTEIMKGIGALPKEEKPAAGKRINEAKQALSALFSDLDEAIEARESAARLGPPVDPTLPRIDPQPGAIHPIGQVREELVGVFRQLGFNVAEGTEVETEFFCFDGLNMPEDHPARDMQDSYYLPGDTHFANVSKKDRERYLLRTHTSTVQVRTMLKEKPPIRIVVPGRCFRRDTPDATHSANFHQIEGLVVDRDITLADLKATLDHFVRAVFGKKAKTRLRPSFFPFTEPSFEMDFWSPDLGKLSNKWIEILGCGLVDPAVFEACEVDAETYSGYAFGMGIERIAMILQGVDDIRFYYQNDRRFLRQFTA